MYSRTTLPPETTLKVQRIRSPHTATIRWMVLDNNYCPVEPVQSYLNYLDHIERSPNTIHSYANHLKLYWEFLQVHQLDWLGVTLETLAKFIAWLRHPNPKTGLVDPPAAVRTERTINVILAAVSGFYGYQERLGTMKGIDIYRDQFQPIQPYKPFLNYLNRSRDTKTHLLKLKEPRNLPKTLTQVQVETLVTACKHLRDKLLICLLYETGMRIGQVLGLRHEDMCTSGDNHICIIPRQNANGARPKTRNPYIIHTTKELMQLYSEYLINEYPETIDSDYVFVNIWRGQRGQPITYSTVQAFFRSIGQATGITVYPHLFRHTHATELLQSGWDMSYVQKRLGHASVQTTINTYAHLTDDDLKAAYQTYQQGRKQ